MKQTLLFTGILIVALLATVGVQPASAGDFASSTVSFTKPAVALGLAACLLSSKEHGMERGIKAMDAVTVSVGIAQIIKTGTDMGSGGKIHHGFPSSHTAAAFAVATSLSEIHPKRKWLYYGGAALIGYSLVRTGNHSWMDVAGGAGLGIGVSKLSSRQPDGLLLSKMFRF